jgi:ankyrin repeat protein
MALIEAAFSGDIDELRRLIAEGADPNVQAPDGSTPLMSAAVGHSVPALQLLLEAGADPNLRAVDGATALMKASLWDDDPICVELLLSHGADPAAVDADGWTAGRIAAKKGHARIARLLGQQS